MYNSTFNKQPNWDNRSSMPVRSRDRKQYNRQVDDYYKKKWLFNIEAEVTHLIQNAPRLYLEAETLTDGGYNYPALRAVVHICSKLISAKIEVSRGRSRLLPEELENFDALAKLLDYEANRFQALRVKIFSRIHAQDAFQSKPA